MTNASEEFFIVSLKHSKLHAGGDFILFWRPKNCGYTLFLEAAGRYSRKDVEESADYYNNGESTLAVPCSVVEGLAHRAVYSDDWRKIRDARHTSGDLTNR